MSRHRPTYTSILTLIFVAASFSGVRAQLGFTEDFTTNAFKDTSNTTAVWDTAGGELRLLPFAITNVGSFDTPGNAVDVAVSGNFAFVADDPNVVIFDISDPTNPAVLATFASSNAQGVNPQGDLLYVADGAQGLRIVSIYDPTSPLQLGVFNTPGSAVDVAVEGDVAYVADGSAGIIVIDVSDAFTPFQIGSYNTPGSAIRVDVSGNHLYVADRSGNGLVVLDVSDPTTPVLAGSLVLAGDTWSVVVDGDLAYVGDAAAGLAVLDVSDPANPTLLGSIDPGTVRQTAVAGDIVYAAGYAMTHAIDVSDPANPFVVGSWDNPGIASAVAVDGEHAFLAAGTAGGLQVLRTSQIMTHPVEVGLLDPTGWARAVAVAGDHAFVAEQDSSLLVIDISDPANPVGIGSLGTPGDVTDVAVAGDYAFLSDRIAGLQVIDISNPANPVTISTLVIPDEAQGIAVAGDRAFVAAGGSGLRVIDVSNPASPVEIGFLIVLGYANDVVIAGNHAFVTAGSRALRVIDISDPANPFEIGYAATGSTTTRVAVAGNHAFVTVESRGLRVFDISDPANPVLVGDVLIPGTDFAVDVAVAGDHVFVAQQGSGLLVVNILDPANPVKLGLIEIPGDAGDVAVAGAHAFVTEPQSGLHVIKVFQREVDTDNDTGQSVTVDGRDDTIQKVRLATAQTDSVIWELSADGGANWSWVLPDNTWHAISVPSTDLVWRSTHFWGAPGVNPAVSQLTLEWLPDFAFIDAISDIPNDQGRQVRVEWTRSSHDFIGDTQQIVEYAIYRRIDPNLTSSTIISSAERRGPLGEAAQQHAETMQQAGWDFLVTVPVRVEDNYAVVVPTLADSTITAGLYSTTFMVSALTATPGVFFDSHPDSGYSVDNLAPGAPQNLVASYNSGGGNLLSWDPAPEEDFKTFRIYRDTDPNFVPSGGTYLGDTGEPAWTDPGVGGGVYYKITSVDHSGNESDPAAPGTVTAVASPTAPITFGLEQNYPNPFNPSTTIEFSLASGSQVTLAVYNIRGQNVRTLLSDFRSPDHYRITWNGLDDAGNPVASGAYFYRLVTPTYTSTRKLVLLK